jgi:hypothetical protein
MKNLDSTYASPSHIATQLLTKGSSSSMGIIARYLENPMMTNAIDANGKITMHWAALKYIASNLDNFASMLIMMIKDDSLRKRAIKYHQRASK